MHDPDERFTALYDRHYRSVLGYTLLRAGQDAAEDVVSETFLVAWRRLDDLPDPPLPWLLGVARNLLYKQYDSGRRRQALADRIAAATTADDLAGPDVADRIADRTAVRAALNSLAARVEDLAEDGYRRRRAADLARITAAGRGPSRADRRVLPVRRRRGPLVMAGVATAAVAAGVLAVPDHGRGAPRVPPRALDARSVLLAGADLAAKQPETAHGAYWYSQIREVERARRPAPGRSNGGSANGRPRSGPYFPFRAYASITWENWDPYRQGMPSRTVDRDIQSRFATPADKAAWQRAGSPSLTDMKPFSADGHADEPYLELGPKGTTMAGLAKLPTTSEGLRKLVVSDRNRRIARLRSLHAQHQELSLTEDILNAGIGVITSPAPPKVRAAAYRMLAAQEGIRGIGPARDGLGRSGGRCRGAYDAGRHPAERGTPDRRSRVGADPGARVLPDRGGRHGGEGAEPLHADDLRRLDGPDRRAGGLITARGIAEWPRRRRKGGTRAELRAKYGM